MDDARTTRADSALALDIQPLNNFLLCRRLSAFSMKLGSGIGGFFFLCPGRKCHSSLMMLRKPCFGSLLVAGIIMVGLHPSTIHGNCCNDVDEFVKQTPVTQTLFHGELETPNYKRFMTFGYK